MRQTLRLVLGIAALAALGCGGDGTTGPAPGGDGAAVARQFERLADSVGQTGDSVTSSALRHAADIVRLAGHATPVTLTIDGASRDFLAVAEQIDYPNLMCSWPGDSGVAPPGDSTGTVGTGGTMPASGPGECTVLDTTSMRTLIAWEPTQMAEVVRLVADPGAGAVDSAVPDIMVSLPTMPDSVGGTGGGSGGGVVRGTPGFLGEYLVGVSGSWFAVEGTQSNALEASTGACTADHATIDWARFDCAGARFRFAFDMRVEPVSFVEPPLGAPGGPIAESGDTAETHTLAMGSTPIDGVRLTVVGWEPPPAPPPLPAPGPGPDPIPMPPDTAVTASP